MIAGMAKVSRVNVILDDEHAIKLHRIAERVHANPGTVARSLLAAALDDADPDARNVTELLDRIPDAFDSARQGLAEYRAGRARPLDEL